MSQISRREFVALSVASAAATPFALTKRIAAASAAVTAQDVIDRIKKNIGVEWPSDGVDTFKAGDPSTVVTGIVTTSMATLEVLENAVRAGANLVITAAPTFYTRADLATPGARGQGAGAGEGRGAIPARGAGAGAAPSPATVSGPGTGASAPMPPTPPLPQPVVPVGRAAAPPDPGTLPPDPVYAGKNKFIAEHKLVVFRLTEHWNQRRPDPRAQGLATAMGWAKYKAGDDGLRYEIPGITLETLAGQLKKTLSTRGGIRAIGDPATIVRRIGLLPGFTSIQPSIAMMPTVDVIVAGEVQEWESATYAQDVVFAGNKKGFISIGRVVNEAPGMQACADWLKTIVTEVPVRFISAGDPYWRPL